MRYQTEGEVSVVMATKLSSVPTVTENLVHKQSEGRHRRERRHHAVAYGRFWVITLEYFKGLMHCF